MEKKIYIAIKNNLGTPQVRAFSSKEDALYYMVNWWNQTLRELNALGHQIIAKGFAPEIGDGIIETENGNIEFDLLTTKVDDPKTLKNF